MLHPLAEVLSAEIQAARESSRTAHSARPFAHSEGTDASKSIRENSRSDSNLSGLVFQELAKQEILHQEEASDMVQAIAASCEHHTAPAVAQKEKEDNETIAMSTQEKDAQVSQKQQEAEKLVNEANRSAAEAEGVNLELAQKFKMLQTQPSQRDNHVTTRSVESQSMKSISMQQASEKWTIAEAVDRDAKGIGKPDGSGRI